MNYTVKSIFVSTVMFWACDIQVLHAEQKQEKFIAEQYRKFVESSSEVSALRDKVKNELLLSEKTSFLIDKIDKSMDALQKNERKDIATSYEYVVFVTKKLRGIAATLVILKEFGVQQAHIAELKQRLDRLQAFDKNIRFQFEHLNYSKSGMLSVCGFIAASIIALHFLARVTNNVPLVPYLFEAGACLVGVFGVFVGYSGVETYTMCKEIWLAYHFFARALTGLDVALQAMVEQVLHDE